MSIPAFTSTHAPERYIGLMSGTSLDGVDGVLVQWDADHGMQVQA